MKCLASEDKNDVLMQKLLVRCDVQRGQTDLIWPVLDSTITTYSYFLF